MADTIFDSYIRSVYGSGTDMHYFDSIQGGAFDNDIFGGVDPSEIIQGMDSFSFQNDNPSNHPKKDTSEMSDAESSDTPIIGYIQIGIHTTPIVDNNNDSIVAPMELSLSKTKCTSISPEDISDALFRLDI